MRFKIPSSHVEGAKRWLENVESNESVRKKLSEAITVTDKLEIPNQSPRRVGHSIILGLS